MASAPAAAPTPQVPVSVTLGVAHERDIARVRKVARETCHALGMSAFVLQKVATVASELARNMFLYAGGGELSIIPCPQGRRRICVQASDCGPGIPGLAEILAGRYKSRTGLGLGLLGSKRLSDRFDVCTGRTGTKITAELDY